ncbi:hypothetical protein RB653_005327 [Dictyostelium firmibasis]|uniref:Uncharacterized protein n=1 Tax=Dictyostelium firmibasis TaxID=79012 RepID=A0AAN7YSV8_9MYCE
MTVVDKKKVTVPKKVEKTSTQPKITPENSKKNNNNNNNNKKKLSTTIENKFKVVGLEELLSSSNKKQEKKQITFDQKGDKLVEQILSFFKIQGITNIKLNEYELLEKEIKNNSNKIIKRVSNNYTLLNELMKELLVECNEVKAISSLLVITRSVSSYNSPKFVDTIIKKDKITMVPTICKYFTDLSSDDLVQLIGYILANQSFKTIKKQLEQQPTQSLTQQSSIDNSIELDSLLSLPLNHDFMLTSLRSLSIDTVLLLLNYLYSRISLFSLNESTESTENNTNTTPILSLKQIIEWISLIFDTHFQELIKKIENINHYFGPIRSLQNNAKSFFYTKSFIEFLEKSSLTKSIENNDYSIYHYKF